MKNLSSTYSSTRMSKIAIGLAVLLILFGMMVGPRIIYFISLRSSPWLVGELRIMSLYLIGYSSAILGLICLWLLYQLIHQIDQDLVFIPTNVNLLSKIQTVIMIESFVTILGGLFTYIPLLLVPIAGLFITLIIQVIKDSFKRAIALQEELDQVI